MQLVFTQHNKYRSLLHLKFYVFTSNVLNSISTRLSNVCAQTVNLIVGDNVLKQLMLLEAPMSLVRTM